MQNIDNKYYTPDISELYIGYEFEHSLLDCNWFTVGWKKEIVDIDSDYKLFQEYPSFLRTKYLDSEDILSLGFIYTEAYDSFKKGDICIWFDKKDENTFTVSLGEFNTIMFRKRSINELKKILEWIK